MIHSGRKCFFLNAIFFVFGRNGALFERQPEAKPTFLTINNLVDLQTFLVVGPKKTFSRVKVVLHGTIRSDDFRRNPAL